MKLKIVEYLPENVGEELIYEIENCGWSAAGILADLLKDMEKFNRVLRGGSLFVMKEEEQVVSFATLTGRECIEADDLYLWIGFVFTMPERRGRGCAGRLIGHICRAAHEKGYLRAYVATESAGKVYEKYGFSYMEDRMDVFGAVNRIYYRELNTGLDEAYVLD